MATSRTSSHHDIILQLYRQLDDELLRLENDLDIFEITVLKDLGQIKGFHRIFCDDGFHQRQTTIQVIRHLLHELSSGIIWLSRQSQDFARFKDTKYPTLVSLWDFNEHSLDDWAGVTVHRNYRQLDYVGKHTRFPYLFHRLLDLRNNMAYQ
jgi:hypothetical protein